MTTHPIQSDHSEANAFFVWASLQRSTLDSARLAAFNLILSKYEQRSAVIVYTFDYTGIRVSMVSPALLTDLIDNGFYAVDNWPASLETHKWPKN